MVQVVWRRSTGGHPLTLCGGEIDAETVLSPARIIVLIMSRSGK
jgi:hypothetical protein